MGAYHSAELPLIMGSFGDYRGRGTPLESATSQVMQDMYLAFAGDPENGLEKLGWPKYTSGLVEVFGGNAANGSESTHHAVPRAQVEKECSDYYS